VAAWSGVSHEPHWSGIWRIQEAHRVCAQVGCDPDLLRAGQRGERHVLAWPLDRINANRLERKDAEGIVPRRPMAVLLYGLEKSDSLMPKAWPSFCAISFSTW
jgi:hypothetical protein